MIFSIIAPLFIFIWQVKRVLVNRFLLYFSWCLWTCSRLLMEWTNIICKKHGILLATLLMMHFRGKRCYVSLMTAAVVLTASRQFSHLKTVVQSDVTWFHIGQLNVCIIGVFPGSLFNILIRLFFKFLDFLQMSEVSLFKIFSTRQKQLKIVENHQLH